jgi:hypothetical protein
MTSIREMDIFSAIFRHGSRFARSPFISMAYARAGSTVVGKPGEFSFLTDRGSSDAGARRAGATVQVEAFMGSMCAAGHAFGSGPAAT